MRFSLRHKILLFSLLLALLPLGFAGWSMITITQDELKSAVNDYLVNTANETSNAIDNRFSAWRSALLLLRDNVSDPHLELAAKIALLENWATHADGFIALKVLVEGFPPSLYLKQDLAEVLDTRAGTLESLFQERLKPTSEQVFTVGGAVLHPHVAYLPLAVSFELSNSPAWLVGYADMERIRQLLRSHPIAQGGKVLLVDRSGDLLYGDSRSTARRPLEKALELLRQGPRAVSIDAFDDGGSHRLGGFAIPANLPWAVVVSVAADDAYHTLHRMRNELALWMSAGLLAAVAVAWWFSIKITRPVLEVAAVAQRVGAGDLSVRVKTVGGRDELSLLGECINQMIQDLIALNAAKAGTFYYDPSLDQGQWDARSLEIFGLHHVPSFRGSLGDWVACVHPDDCAAAEHAVYMALREQNKFDLEYRIVRYDGDIRHIRTQAFVVRDEDGRLRKAGGLHFDITSHKQAEAALIRAKDVAEATSRAKSAFLANMSHELRTPLNAVLGYAQLLEQDEALAEGQRHNVQIIRRSGEYLLTLINDILDLAKIEAGRFELAPGSCALTNFFQTITEMFAIRAREKGVAFRYEVLNALPAQVECDEKRLRQIVINLLGNAIKFTEHGEVVLRSRYQDNALSVEVQDTGVGIPSDQLQSIFEPFQQSGTQQYKAQGTGLGLAITYKLIKLMGGEVEVQSILGHGSTFHVRLPVRELESRSRFEEETLVPAHVVGYRRITGEGPVRVLIVDDVAENRDFLRQLLQPLGFELAQSGSGEEAVGIARAWQPDVILMDIVMSDMNGLEATRTLRAQPEFQDTVILALSASTFSEDRQHALDAGCDDHIAKPVHNEILFAALQKFLPLQWESSPTALISPPSTPVTVEEALDAALPDGTAQYLLERAKRGDIRSIREHLEQLIAEGKRSPQVEELQKLAASFKLKQIRKLLERESPEQSS